MPTDYKALERQIIAEQATRKAELAASQATAQAKALAAFRGPREAADRLPVAGIASSALADGREVQRRRRADHER
jgi:hypothetical protein